MHIVTSGNFWLQYKAFTFSGGEVSVKLDPKMTSFMYQSPLPFYIKAHLTTAGHIMELCMLTDALRREFGDMDIHLECPYLPYARQDRVCAPGESLSLKVFCDILNSLNFKTVTVADVHSDVALALLDRVTNVPVERLIGRTIPELYTQAVRPIVVAPDAGSIKKVLKVAQKYDTEMVRADKIRDVNTGAITETVVYTENSNRDFLVVDDICDGGKTFIELAKVLNEKTTGKLSLYVTHGIFSKGLEPLEEWYDSVHCAFPFPGIPLRSIGGLGGV